MKTGYLDLELGVFLSLISLIDMKIGRTLEICNLYKLHDFPIWLRCEKKIGNLYDLLHGFPTSNTPIDFVDVFCWAVLVQVFPFMISSLLAKACIFFFLFAKMHVNLGSFVQHDPMR
jgi:hypothetical protein